MAVYQWKANSNAAPFFSDPSEGFTEAQAPMEALRKVVEDYSHPLGLFSAVILEPSPKNPVLARYMSARAATQERAPGGVYKWEGNDLYVNGVKMPLQEEVFEEVNNGKAMGESKGSVL